MSEQINKSAPPVLEEYRFQSQVPVLGPVIAWLRNAAYSISARWGVQHVIAQQNHVNAQQSQINAQLLERIQELEARLIDQDRDLAHLARTTAEIDLRQRYSMKSQAQSERAD